MDYDNNYAHQEYRCIDSFITPLSLFPESIRNTYRKISKSVKEEEKKLSLKEKKKKLTGILKK